MIQTNRDEGVPTDIPSRLKECAQMIERRASAFNDGTESARLIQIVIDEYDASGLAVDDTVINAARLFGLVLTWKRHGFQRFKLTDSLAALLRMTTPPPMEVRLSPHPAFLVEVPQKFLKLNRFNGEASAASWILVGETGFSSYISGAPTGDLADADVIPSDGVFALATIADDVTTTMRTIVDGSQCLTAKIGITSGAVTSGSESVLGARLISNLIHFMQEFPSCVVAGDARRSVSGPPPVRTVRPPADVVVTREMREAAIRVVSADGIGGIRRAMAHFVRGHWRNQPVGEGRKDVRRTWVKPHKRGDEAFGRVVERITKVTGGEN